MRKTLRLLDWIVSDIDEAKKKLEAVIGISIGLLFGLAGGVVLARMDDIWKL